MGWGWGLLTSHLPQTVESHLPSQQPPLLLSVGTMMEISSEGVWSSFGYLVYKTEEASLQLILWPLLS